MPALKNLNDLEREGRRLAGKWNLDGRHRLSYLSDPPNEAFELEASLVAAEPDALVVSITEKQKNGKAVISLARLSGKWSANEENKIEFEVERESGRKDVLTFRGAWKVGEAHELSYTYRRRSLERKSTVIETLTFKGWWDLSEKNRLTYTFEGDSNAAFRFRGAFQTPSILAKKGEIRYQLGAEAGGRQGRFRTVTFFGKWKLSDQLDLEFEMECADGKKRVLRFGAEFQITEDLSVTARLTDPQRGPLGVEVVFNKEFLNGKAQAFVRLRKSLEESALEAGMTIPW